MLDNKILLEEIIFDKGLRYSDIYSYLDRYYSIKLLPNEKIDNVEKLVLILEKKIGFKKTFDFLTFLKDM
ncbi:MAG: hypothetical protein ACRCZ9_04410 [Fusobacteriaceae bacterium]